jgi:hypothetical protein
MATNRVVMMSREEMLRLIRGEYLEMPGLCLTQAQAQRLWGLEPGTCRSLLRSLTDQKFLCLRVDGLYGRYSKRGPTISQTTRNSPHRNVNNLGS